MSNGDVLAAKKYNSDDSLEVKEFFEIWALYQQVIKHNYMLHEEVIEQLINDLSARGEKPLSILELGCGDAYTVSQVMKKINIAKYYGIDLSEMALTFAQDNLNESINDLTLINGDLVAEINNISQQFDIILAGFSLHHLKREDKNQVLSECKKRLYPDGTLIVYDIVHNENETQKEFLARCVKHFKKNWTQLSQEQLDSACQHVIDHDIPESFHGWQALAKGNYFNSCECIFRDVNEMYAILKFSH